MTIQLFGLLITEPTTMFTDFALGLLTAYFSYSLLDDKSTQPSRSRLFWGLAMIFLALASFCGGSHHGLYLVFTPLTSLILWKVTVLSIGLAAFFMLYGTLQAYVGSSWQRTLGRIAFLKLIAYGFWVLVLNHEFIIVVADYLPNMILILGLALWQKKVSKANWNESGKWLAAGVLVSFIGSGVQQSGFSLHLHFNHNDLFHVIQMLGVFLFYKGAYRLQDSN